jgi:hypothetical protein
MKKTLIAILFLVSINAFAEDFNFKVGGYVDAYIVTDNAKIDYSTDGAAYRDFTYINALKNEFDLNIAQISGVFDFKSKVRGKVTLHHGTLSDDAFGGSVLQEAYVGAQLCEGLWLDAGYFLTHIGGESMLPKDNWLSTHSMVTYFEPFYHAGIKATYTNENFTAGLHILNGNGIFKDNNDNKSFGFFLGYTFSDNFSVSYASIIGNEEARYATPKTHFLNNFCVNAKLMDKLEAKAQVDFATKEKTKSENGELKDGTYLGASAQFRYTLCEHFRTSLRFSYFGDKDEVYTSGLTGMEAALGIEYKPNANSYIRLEGGWMQFDEDGGKGNVFVDSDGKATNGRLQCSLNFGVWID